MASRKFGGTDSWNFSALLKLIEEEMQARERLSAHSTQEGRRPKEYPTGAALFVEAASLQCCLNAAFVNRVTHRRIAILLLELSLDVRLFERVVGASSAWGEVTWQGIAAAKSSALAVRGDIMLLSALASRDLLQGSQDLQQRSQTPVLVLSMLEHHPSIPHRAKLYGPTQANMFFSKLHRLLQSIPTIPPRHREFEL